MQTYTITFGDQAENHVGMQKIGAGSPRGYTIEELEQIEKRFAPQFVTELVRLDQAVEDGDPAAVLIIRKGAKAFVRHRGSLLAEQKSILYDRQAYMYGRVVQKHARHNVCFGSRDQEPLYEEKRGRIVAFENVPFLQQVWQKLPDYFGPLAADLVAEGNYYYDVEKCGISYHGDSERRIVIALRLGAAMPLCYQWYQNGQRVGEKITLNMRHGDMYVMSEKAVGTDWKKRSILTLRHAAGAEKYTA